MMSGKNLLIAEDFEDTRDLLKVIFEMQGARVVTAENGLEALVQARLESFDAILLDLDMPEMDGIEAARELRQGGYEGPIIALSAAIESASGMLENDFTMAVVKPISADDFERIQRKIVRMSSDHPKLTVTPVSRPSPTEMELKIRFLSALPTQEKLIEQLLKEKRYEAVREIAHKLSGVGTMAGLPEISAAGAAVDSGAADGAFLLETIRLVIFAHRPDQAL